MSRKMNALYLGMEIGGTKLQVFLGDGQGAILTRCRHQVDPAKGADGIRDQIKTSLADLQRAHPVKALGVGFGGPVQRSTGAILKSHQVEGWSGFPLRSWLANLSGLPVAIDNDANLAALAEAQAGAGRGLNPVFYLTLGSGVGGGLVVDGEIYHGAEPGEAEVGHLQLDTTGRTVEAACSGWAVDRKIRAAAARDPRGYLAESVEGQEGGEAKHLVAAIAAGDREAEKILEETAADLALGLSHVIHLFHPQIVVLGGGLALAGEPLARAVEDALPRYVMPAFAGTSRLALAELREDAVPVGALFLARDARRSATAQKNPFPGEGRG